MRIARFTAERNSGTGLAARGSVWMLPCVGLLLMVTASGCLMPCIGGVCNSNEPLYISPMARFGAVERKVPEVDCKPVKTPKPWPFFTMGKYWPKLDEWKTSRTAASSARKVLWKQMWDTKTWINAHYREGFTQAYIDVANGGNGEVPAVPPPRYWNAHFRSPKGQWRAERWFDGYRAGAAMALVDMQPLRRITASYDWSIEKPKPPFVSPPVGVGNFGAAPGCPPIQQTAGYGMPGPQRFGPPQMAPGPWPGQPMTPGYGAAPWGQSVPGTPPSLPGPPQGYPGTGPAPNSQPPNAGFGAPPMQPQAQPMTPPQPPSGLGPQPLLGPSGPAGGAPPTAAPGPAATPSGTGGDVVPASGSAARNEPPRPLPQNLIPGFSPFANRPANIPKDDPVWRTRPPGPPDQ